MSAPYESNDTAGNTTNMPNTGNTASTGAMGDGSYDAYPGNTGDTAPTAHGANEAYTTSTTETTHPTGTTTGANDQSARAPPSESMKKGAGSIGHGLKAAAAEIHGTGEALRGNANAVFDRAMNDKKGMEKDEQIARAGEKEMDTGRFSKETEDRERFMGAAKRMGNKGDHEGR